MDFPVPTTRDEMYETLFYLYRHYRMLKNDFENVERQPLTLPKMSFTPKTDEELLEEATVMLAEKHQREIDEKTAEITSQQDICLKQIEETLTAREERVALIREEFDQSIEKVKNNALERGVNDSYTIDRVYALEKEKSSLITQAQRDTETRINELNSKARQLQYKLENVENTLQEVHTLSINAKKMELLHAQEEREMEVLKFNNSQTEKEVKYANALISSDANLELTYMKIKAESLSREMLLQMGYYADVIRCINQYYEPMSRQRAYNEIINESNLSLFLDESYQNLIYQYKRMALDELEAAANENATSTATQSTAIG